MTNYCYDCGNTIRKGHNKKWNRKDAGDDTVNVKHIDDVCECDSNNREGRTDGDSIGVDWMNMETLVEAYSLQQRDYIKAQNKLQDIWFVIAEATSDSPANSAGDYIRQILEIVERD